jgi:hypothetical protein
VPPQNVERAAISSTAPGIRRAGLPRDRARRRRGAARADQVGVGPTPVTLA